MYSNSSENISKPLFIGRTSRGKKNKQFSDNTSQGRNFGLKQGGRARDKKSQKKVSISVGEHCKLSSGQIGHTHTTSYKKAATHARSRTIQRQRGLRIPAHTTTAAAGNSSLHSNIQHARNQGVLSLRETHVYIARQKRLACVVKATEKLAAQIHVCVSRCCMYRATNHSADASKRAHSRKN